MQILDLKFFVDFNLHFNKEVNFGHRYILCKNVKNIKTSRILRDHIWINIDKQLLFPYLQLVISLKMTIMLKQNSML